MFHNFAVGDIIKDVEQAEAVCAAGLEIKSREIGFLLVVARGHSRFTKEKLCRGITLGMVWFRGPRIVLGPEAVEHVLDILQGPRQRLADRCLRCTALELNVPCLGFCCRGWCPQHARRAGLFPAGQVPDGRGNQANRLHSYGILL